MDKSGKNIKCFLGRQSLIGDTIMALPILTYFEKTYPNSYKIWHIAKKCSQSIPIYYNHPLIDKILITDCDEGFGPNDYAEMKKCDIVMNTTPQHPLEHDWPNHRNIFEETWVMAGLTMDAYNTLSKEDKIPKLYKWWNEERRNKCVAIWPCANYGTEAKRSPNQKWYGELVSILEKMGYTTIQCGHPRDFNILADQDIRNLPFFEQIKISESCGISIGTDSGSGLVLGAYGVKQISLLTNHFTGHVRNLEAFGTNNPNNVNFVGIDDPNMIAQERVALTVKEMTK